MKKTTLALSQTAAMQKGSKLFQIIFLLLGSVLLTACSTTVPDNPRDICAVFSSHPDWHDAALDSREKWGAPVHISMAFIYQESAYVHDAQPPMRYFLWVIPIGRASSAYGYAQAQDGTWSDYIDATGNWGADRDDFDDAIDFVGWYIDRSHRLNGVSKWDAYHQYLNYHEGWGGYRQGSYRNKKWLRDIAARVDSRAKEYARQYNGCKDELSRGGFWNSLF